jgi:type VI secretion system secreted protein VgrG
MAQREARIRFEARAGAFRLVRLEGAETISQVHRLRVDVMHPQHTVALAQILGTRVTVTIDAYDGGARPIDGFVADATYLGPVQDQARYRLTLVPWLWFLSRRQDCRIFQNLTVPEIVAQVFSAYPMADHVERLGDTYEKRVYCVQYRETDLDFVLRLLEDEGIAFFFEHTDGRHRLVLTDPASPPRATEGYATVPYFAPEPRARRTRDHLDHWTVEARVQPGKATLRAFDFEKPHADLEVSDNDPRPHREAAHEVYDYPGAYVAAGHGERIVRVRLEELQADYLRSSGGGTAAGLCCGARFRLDGFPRPDQNVDWLVVSVRHSIDVEPPRSGPTDEAEHEPYRCAIAVQPAQVPFRPPRRTPRPMMFGPQTAIVTGPGGEEIYTDRYGRVKVQFHWDRHGRHDANTSCWVRVSNAWAGAAFGGIHIPRIGQEVIVDFLDGDPDRPIITGRVYNGASMPPYGLPGHATQSGIKSNSSKGGGGSNELRFEDSKGSEQVYLHAQKDEAIVVEHDKTETVHHDESITIDHDRTEHVGHDETMSVGNNRTRSVSVNEAVSVGGNQTIHVHGARGDTVDGPETRTVRAGRVDTVLVNEARTVVGPQEQTVLATRIVKVTLAQSHTVGAGDNWDVTAGQRITITGGQTVGITGDQTEDIKAMRTVTVSGDDSLAAGGNRTVEIKGGQVHKVGEDVVFEVGRKVTISAGEEIVIRAGKAAIALRKDGTVTVDGKDITVTGSGELVSKASGNITMKGQKIQHN